MSNTAIRHLVAVERCGWPAALRVLQPGARALSRDSRLMHAERRDRISLARALSKLGFTSRSQARPLITAGRVTVNDVVVKDPDQRIDIERDRVAVDGQSVALESYVYVMMNKPPGVVTTRSDERGRATGFDVLADPALPYLTPVGRLDKESAGLLLFTNDTRWANGITAPEKHIDKIYHVHIDQPINMEDRKSVV